MTEENQEISVEVPSTDEISEKTDASALDVACNLAISMILIGLCLGMTIGLCLITAFFYKPLTSVYVDYAFILLCVMSSLTIVITIGIAIGNCKQWVLPIWAYNAITFYALSKVIAIAWVRFLAISGSLLLLLMQLCAIVTCVLCAGKKSTSTEKQNYDYLHLQQEDQEQTDTEQQPQQPTLTAE